MCRDMYRVMPYAYPPVVGGQQGGAGADPEPEENIPYDFSTLSVSVRSAVESSRTVDLPNIMDYFNGDNWWISIQGVSVLNSELARSCTAKLTISVPTLPTVNFVGTKTYASTKTTYSLGTVKLNGLTRLSFNYYYPTNPDKGTYKVVQNVRGVVQVQKLTIYSPDGEVLQEWTP